MGWNDVGMSAGGKDFLKLADREKVLIHVLGEEVGGPAEPKSFFQFFNQTVQRGIVVPDTYTGAVDKRAQHAFIVWSYRDESPKIWAMGNKLAAQIKGLLDSYDGSLATVDILVTRQGSGKQTSYILAPKPTKFEDALVDGVTLPDLDVAFADGTDEDIENLKQGIVPEGAAEPVEAEAGAEGGDGSAEDAGTGAEGGAAEDETDEQREFREFKEAQAAKKASAAGKGGTATKAAPAKGAVAGDPRIALVKFITHAFANSPKYKTPTARMAAIKGVAKGKTTLSQLSVAELTILKGKIK